MAKRWLCHYNQTNARFQNSHFGRTVELKLKRTPLKMRTRVRRATALWTCLFLLAAGAGPSLSFDAGGFVVGNAAVSSTPVRLDGPWVQIDADLIYASTFTTISLKTSDAGIRSQIVPGLEASNPDDNQVLPPYQGPTKLASGTYTIYFEGVDYAGKSEARQRLNIVVISPWKYAAIGRADTAKPYLGPAKYFASQWAPDAELVLIAGQTVIEPPGSVGSSKEDGSNSWTMVFHSVSRGLRCFAGGGGEILPKCYDRQGVMSFSKIPPPIRGEFIDTSRAAAAAYSLADRKWNGLRCEIFFMLRESKAGPRWNAEFVCWGGGEHDGGYVNITIDAVSGRVLGHSDFYDDKGEY